MLEYERHSLQGKWVYTYRCARCSQPMNLNRAVTRGLPYCSECKKIVSKEKQRAKYAKYRETRRKGEFSYRTREELDFGMIGALYKAHRTIEWIAYDQVTKPEIVVEILKELRARGRL